MNVKAKPFKLDLKKIAFIVILLAIVGYKYYADNIAKPQVAESGNSAVQDQDQKKFSSGDYKVKTFPESKSNSGKSTSGSASNQKQDFGTSGKLDFNKTGSNNSTESKTDGGLKFKPLKPSGNNSQQSNSKQTDSNKPFLASAGGQNKKSPAGLIYGMGARSEHRTDHVLRHAEDQPTRPTHGVFKAKGDDVFRLIDEAYELVKKKSKQVKSESSRGNMAHVIDMKRKIGFKGGQSGKRAGNPALYKVKLILADGNRVITAYPY